MSNIDIAIWPLLGTATALTVDGTTLVPVGAALGVCGAVWALSRKVKGWEDETRETKQTLKRVIALLESRPCVRPLNRCELQRDAEERKEASEGGE